jgi:hypothetical protein
VQREFIGGTPVDAEPLREVLSSWIQIRDLARLQEVGNQKLKRKLSELARALEDEYEVCLNSSRRPRSRPLLAKTWRPFKNSLPSCRKGRT